MRYTNPRLYVTLLYYSMHLAFLLIGRVLYYYGTPKISLWYLKQFTSCHVDVTKSATNGQQFLVATVMYSSTKP